MKMLIVSLLLTVSSYYAFSQCNPYFTIEDGMQREMTNYNTKDKVEGRQLTEVVSFDENEDGWTAVMNLKMYDKKDKLTYEKDDVEMSCNDGVIHMNMDRFLPQETLQAFKDMNMDFKIDNLEIPDNLEVGMTLDEGGITISGSIPMTIETTVTDRKVVAKESITTSAGTFECFKITYTMGMDMGVMKRETNGAEWVAKNVGVVKTETYNEGGKLMGYSLLTKVK